MSLKSHIIKLAKIGARKAVEHAPAALAGAAVVGVGIVLVETIKATIKSKDIIEEHQEKIDAIEKDYPGDDNKELRREMKKKVNFAFFKKILPKYAKPLIFAVLAMVCIISCNVANARRQAAIALLYNTSEATLRAYEDKIKEMVGPKKAQEIKDETVIEQARPILVAANDYIPTGHGNQKFIDTATGRKFLSNTNFIDKAIHGQDTGLIDRCRNEMFISQNEMYMQFDWPTVDDNGNVMGFDQNNGGVRIDRTWTEDEYGDPVCLLSCKFVPWIRRWGDGY